MGACCSSGKDKKNNNLDIKREMYKEKTEPKDETFYNFKVIQMQEEANAAKSTKDLDAKTLLLKDTQILEYYSKFGESKHKKPLKID